MNTPTAKVQTTYLKDYQVPDFLVDELSLQFELGEEKTMVYAELFIQKNPNKEEHQRPLVLQGDGLKLISLQLNQKELTQPYQVTPNELTIHDVPDNFSLQIVTEIYPQKNTALSGLYRSGKMFCTQCEAQGFRRITYYLDRPDVMALFTTTIVADKTRYPILLSNGNKVDQGELDNNRHWVKWSDPFKKPSYLFALVAGDLYQLKDTFRTRSGKNVSLEFFVEPENKDKCTHAIESLKNAMRWDEEVYGREYDLDIYMVVAVNDFNMGAMENKGLNIFNSKYVLADKKSATDYDYQAIEAVIGHEYFHNWTGNRITCRDWFQLSLKEGLTVFREQQFSAAMGSAPVKRISDVKIIRTRQFAEDSGPMAHPVRPDSYIEINNFYTTTIYNKGAEVIRMLYTILGEAKFRKGMDLYFDRYDGQAVTIEDFVAAFEEANHYPLDQFYRWYEQAGTPSVHIDPQYDPERKLFTLRFNQQCKKTPDNKEKEPFLIPINIAFYDNKGHPLPVVSKNTQLSGTNGHYVLLNAKEQEFIFEGLDSKPIPSLLGDFSAPIKLSYPYTQDELVLLMKHDHDLFNRWDAAQRIGSQAIFSLMEDYREDRVLQISPILLNAYKELLEQKISDPHLLAQMLMLPSFNYIAEELPRIEVDALIAARKTFVFTLATSLKENFEKLYQLAKEMDDGEITGASIGYRALKNVCLSYLTRTNEDQLLKLAQEQYENAQNMTDAMGALSAINLTEKPIRQALFEDFYQKWKKDPLVVNKWLALQASSDLPNTLDKVKKLMSHEAFDINNPNKVYALINTFGAANPECFHANQGAGYQFIAENVINLNERNPQIAARILEPLSHWKRLDDKHGQLMKEALLSIQSSGNLSEDVYEIVTKALI